MHWSSNYRSSRSHPVKYRIVFKLYTLVYCRSPSCYLSDCVAQVSTRPCHYTLRSADWLRLLSTASSPCRGRWTRLFIRCMDRPNAWNSVPADTSAAPGLYIVLSRYLWHIYCAVLPLRFSFLLLFYNVPLFLLWNGHLNIYFFTLHFAALRKSLDRLDRPDPTRCDTMRSDCQSGRYKLTSWPVDDSEAQHENFSHVAIK